MTYIKDFKTFITENRLKHKASDWEGRAKISRSVRKNLFKKRTKEEVRKVWEDAPMNATGDAVSTNEPIVRKKKKDKSHYELWRRLPKET